MEAGFDERLRAAAFAYLDEIRRRSGGFVTWQELQAFTFEGRRIPLITQRGIRTVSGLPGGSRSATTLEWPAGTRKAHGLSGSTGDMP